MTDLCGVSLYLKRSNNWEETSIDLSTRESFLDSLEDDDERQLVLQVESLAKSPDYRFFHWEIEFPEVFFGFVDDNHRQIKHKNQIAPKSAGFDCVVGNPPYDVMEKDRGGEETPHAKTIHFVKSHGTYSHCLGGKLNIYRPFVVRSVTVTRKGGRYSQIIPMSLLGDISLSSTRGFLAANTRIVKMTAFPQKDDPRNRVFEDAKLSTCIPFVETHTPDASASFDVLTVPGKSPTEDGMAVSVTASDLALLDDATLPIPICTQDELHVALKIHAGGQRLRDVATINRGEINQTTFKKYISTDQSHRPLLKGVEVKMFGFNESLSQGERQYFDEATFEQQKRPKRPVKERIATQRISGVDEKRRLVCAHSSNSAYFADSTNSVVPNRNIDLYLLLGVMNSAVLNWRFDLTSTNNNLGTNELEALPFPKEVPEELAGTIIGVVQEIINDGGVVTAESHQSLLMNKLDALICELFDLADRDAAVIASRK